MLDWQFRRSGPERKEFDMNWDIVEGNWKQFKGQVKTQRSKLTHDHPDVIVGKRVELAAKIQEASPEMEGTMKEEIPPRRLVLRGALLLGCSPWVRTQAAPPRPALHPPAQILPPQRRPAKCHRQACSTRLSRRASRSAAAA